MTADQCSNLLVHRSSHRKIIWPLHLLVFLTFTSFILPADTTGISNRVAISSTMFLALTSLAYVAAETLPELEYLTSCDKIAVFATIVLCLL
jgi:hypothetical protein